MYKTTPMKNFILLIFLLLSICVTAQNSETPESKTEFADTDSILFSKNLDNIETIELPPLSTFLASVYDHPSIQIYESKREEEEALLKETQSKWLNYLRVVGNYQYGQVTGLTKTETDEMIYSLSSRAQHQYNVGIAVSIPFGELFGQKHKNKVQQSRINQIQYQLEMSVEERKLMILHAYNQVVEQLATLKAKSDAAALYNAQMKITEQDFINGTIDITTLSVERSRRTSAVVQYQEGRAALHNSITLLEMLTNIKIIN